MKKKRKKKHKNLENVDLMRQPQIVKRPKKKKKCCDVINDSMHMTKLVKHGTEVVMVVTMRRHVVTYLCCFRRRGSAVAERL